MTNCSYCGDKLTPPADAHSISFCALHLKEVNKKLLEACKRAAQGYRNLVEFQILPHEKWDKDVIEEIECIQAAIAAAEGEA